MPDRLLTPEPAGKLAKIQQLVHRMEKEEEAFEFGPGDEVAAVAGVLKVRRHCSSSTRCVETRLTRALVRAALPPPAADARLSLLYARVRPLARPEDYVVLED